MSNGQLKFQMSRKKSSISTTIKQYTQSSSMISRDASIKKMSFCERGSRNLDRSSNFNAQLPRKSSLSYTKSGLKQLEQSEKKAIRLFYGKRYQQSFEMLRSCAQQVQKLQSAEHRVYVNYLYTQFYFKLGQYDQSLEHYQLSKSAYCNSSQQKKLTAYILNLECLHLSLLYEMGDFEQMLVLSADLLDKIEVQSQQWFQCKWSRMKALIQLDRCEEAECIGRVIIEKTTKVSEKVKYTLKMAICLQKRGLHGKAMQLLENIVREKDGKQYNPVYGRIAELSLIAGDIIKAIYCLEKIKRSHSENTAQNEFKQSCKALARLYSQAGDDLKCMQNCEQTLEQAQLQDFLLLGDALARLQNKKQAIKVYQRILYKQLRESSRLALFMRILPLLESNELNAYQQQFLVEAQSFRSGESVVVLTEYGNNIRKKGDYSRAEYFYKQAAALSSAIELPEYTFVIYCNLGEMFEDLEKKTESSVYYSKALKLNVQHELTTSISKRVSVMRG